MGRKLNCIMAIDDDEATNYFTRLMLEESGLVNEIKLMQSGKEALAYLERSDAGINEEFPSPDLIFLDINMPAMNGWEFLEEYRKINRQRRTLVVMLTTSLFPEDKVRAERSPEISGFEHKPLTIDKIASILEKYFPDEDLQALSA